MKEKVAAGVLVQNPVDSRLYLAFRRKKSGDSGVSLPCGKSEDGEQVYQTARRECLEETGWSVFLHMLEPFCSENESDGFTVWIFSGDLDEERGKIRSKSSEEGEAVWATAEELIAGPYGEFNRRALIHFGKISE
jgi:8-oxo-dGTP pyrophosphatase MutT (NUDIX family)